MGLDTAVDTTQSSLLTTDTGHLIVYNIFEGLIFFFFNLILLSFNIQIYGSLLPSWSKK